MVICVVSCLLLFVGSMAIFPILLVVVRYLVPIGVLFWLIEGFVRLFMSGLLACDMRVMVCGRRRDEAGLRRIEVLVLRGKKGRCIGKARV